MHNKQFENWKLLKISKGAFLHQKHVHFHQLTVLLQAEIGMSWAWKNNFFERVSGLNQLVIQTKPAKTRKFFMLYSLWFGKKYSLTNIRCVICGSKYELWCSIVSGAYVGHIGFTFHQNFGTKAWKEYKLDTTVIYRTLKDSIAFMTRMSKTFSNLQANSWLEN